MIDSYVRGLNDENLNNFALAGTDLVMPQTNCITPDDMAFTHDALSYYCNLLSQKPRGTTSLESLASKLKACKDIMPEMTHALYLQFVEYPFILPEILNLCRALKPGVLSSVTAYGPSKNSWRGHTMVMARPPDALT